MSQDLKKDLVRSIEVTGSAELEVDPDEIRMTIKIEEYWEEEFKKKSEFKDYRTKVPLDKIEQNLLDQLSKIGIKKEDLIIKSVGNHWRYYGKDFLVSKEVEFILHDFKKVNEVTSKVNVRGIKNLHISKLSNKDIVKYRKQVKINALKAAQNKAAYLLESLGKELGDIISITEINNDNNFYFRSNQNALSNTLMSSESDDGIDNFKKIKLRYEIAAKFEIK